MGADPYDPSEFTAFLLSDAGEQLLIDAMEWLNASWQEGSSCFWKRAVERGHFENLLRRAWQRHFTTIRQRPEALKAFKTLTLNLAAHQVASAIEIQRQIGSK